MKEKFIALAFVVSLIFGLFLLVAGSAYWKYYACTQKFPNVAWYVCLFSN